MAIQRISKARSAVLIAAAIAAAPAFAGPNDNRKESRTAIEAAYAPNAPASKPALATAIGRQRAAPDGNPLSATPLSALSETRDRPLFSASRRPPQIAKPVAPPPPPAPAAPPPPEPPAPPPFALVGTIINSTSAIALVKNPSTEVVTRLRVGEENLGWRVTSVGARSILVEKGERSVALDFPVPQGSPGAQAAPNVSLQENRREHH